MIKRNQVIITALVIMVGVAGYLNYLDNNSINNEIMLNDDGEVASLIPNNSLPANSNIDEQIGIALNEENYKKDPGTKQSPKSDLKDKNNNLSYSSDSSYDYNSNNFNHTSNRLSNSEEAVFVNSSLDTSYFVQAKLEREQARSKEKEILDEIINNKNITESKRSECADHKIEIQKRIEKETAAESMIESKGFSEVYVRIDDETVDVVVNKETLSDAEIAQIEDIVKRKTGLSADKIRISTMKK